MTFNAENVDLPAKFRFIKVYDYIFHGLGHKSFYHLKYQRVYILKNNFDIQIFWQCCYKQIIKIYLVFRLKNVQCKSKPAVI